MAETAGLQRAACLALADRFGVGHPGEAGIRQELVGLRLFGDAHGVFDPQRYAAFLAEIRADAQIKEADVARVLAEDIRIRQIESLLAGPGYVPTIAVEHELTFSTTQWFLSAAVFSVDDLGPIEAPTPDVLADYYAKNRARFEIPERVETDYVRFRAEDFVGYEPLPEDEVLEHFERDRERFAPSGNGLAVASSTVFAQVRPKVEESLRLEHAGRNAAAAAANFAVELFERRITADSPALEALIRQSRGERWPAPVLERKTVPPGGNWTAEIVEAAFQLGTSRFGSDALAFGRDHIVLLWRGNQPRRIPALDEVQDKVLEAYRNRQRQAQLQRLGQEWSALAAPQLATGRTFETVCEGIPGAPAMKYRIVGPFTRQAPPDSLPTAVLQALGDAPVLSLTGLIREKNEVYWIHVAGKRKPRIDRSAPEYLRMRSQLMATAADAWRSTVLAGLVEDELSRIEQVAK